MFLIVLALFFTVVFFLANDSIDQSREFTDKITRTINNSIIVQRLDSFAIANNLDEQLSYDLRCNIITEAISIEDSLYIDEGIIQLNAANSGFNTIDFVTFSAEELIEKYGIEERGTKLLIIQAKRLLENPSESIRYIIGNGTWVIISTILLLSIVFLVLYRNFLFAEHVIFHTIGHTRLLLTSSTLLFFNAITIKLPILTVGIFLLITGAIYFFLDMKRMYKQGLGLTFFKFAISSFSYLMLVMIVFFATSLVSFFIF